jgi:beta-phosphoglucomutase-like phosphatase (HAD superfamily)
MLGLDDEVPLITRDLVRHAKPDPDLFVAAAEALTVRSEDCIVVGDSVWDLLEDPADLLDHLDEIGVRDMP